MNIKHKIKVKKMWCDNGEESKALEALCKQENHDVIFKFNALGTLQQNGLVEEKIATLFGRVCLIFNGGDFSVLQSWVLWVKVSNTATQLENPLVKTGDETSAFH